MKAVCAFCGFPNPIEQANCAQCGESLASAQRVKTGISWAAWVPALPVAAGLLFAAGNMQSTVTTSRAELAKKIDVSGEELSKEISALNERYGRKEAEEEAKHRAWMKDERVVSGALAKERHAAEWERRKKHDPAFAASLVERTLLEVERLGKDPALQAETALQKVTELISPPGSRIEVTSSGSKFVVRMAFRLSAVTPFEAGSMTSAKTSVELRKQVEEATARVMQSLYDYGGSRGIERISVSCNRAVVEEVNGLQRLRMRSVFRASVDGNKAAEVANWRTLSLAEVSKILTVEHDMTSRIMMLRQGHLGLTLDPNEPLEF